MNARVQGKKNIDFFISVLLVANTDSPQGLAETMRTHLNTWVKTGLCKKVRLSSGIRKERIKRFLEEYS